MTPAKSKDCINLTPLLRLSGIIVLLLSISPSIFTQPSIPKFEPLKPLGIKSNNTPPVLQGLSLPQRNPLLPLDPYAEQNKRTLRQAGVSVPGEATPSNQGQLAEIQADQQQIAFDEHKRVRDEYQNKLLDFLTMNPDNFSISKAIYLSESAFAPELPTYEAFRAALRQCAEMVTQILKREGLNEKNNTAVNFGIQKLFSQSNIFFDSSSKTKHHIERIKYDFNDPWGEKDWRRMFVSKVLLSGTGQCHSLPLLFLCIAEQFNAKTWLSLSPNHSFIQYFDENGHRYNFETTNGNLVTQSWLMQSTYVNATALKNKTYLDTLSSKKLYAQCLSDLLSGYLVKNGYDEFSDGLAERVLFFDSVNLSALMIKANYYRYIFLDNLERAGNPPADQYQSHPKLYQSFRKMREAQQNVENLGFRSMPPEAYENWLRSNEFEKEKMRNRTEQERLKKEIEKLKKVKVTFKNTPKN